jgi:transaldolase / glucose-6-phosphate isomerase
MSDRNGLTAGGDRLAMQLGEQEGAVAARLASWQADGFGRRLWEKDFTLWSPSPQPELTDRMGWLGLPESMQGELDRLVSLGEAAKSEGFRDAVVLGMGGSSLAPEVFSHTFGHAPGHPQVTVLDSTHPAAVRALADRLDPAKSLFVVSSKSGTTTEMLSFFYTFWERVTRALPAGADAGRHFVAITDPGTPLEKLAHERRFRDVFSTPPEVGGRYSAFTHFGLVPAALAGADVRGLLERGRAMAKACGPTVAAAESPGLRLGAALGELTLAGRDKVTLLTSPAIGSFPDWLEQLIAESTGKVGRGIVPVVEPLGTPAIYGADRFFVALVVEGDSSLDAPLAALAAAGHPVARIHLDAPLDLGREIFRWEIAVAAASAVIGVQPFNQPDVQLAKQLAGEAMKAATEGTAPQSAPGAAPGDGAALAAWLLGAGAGTYLGVQAYLAPSAETSAALHEIQRLLRARTRFATTLGYGPRFLHSTGQLHKGGPASGRFLQLVDPAADDLAVPETAYTFGTLIRAQADGDRQALEQRGRKVLRVQLGGDVVAGPSALSTLLAGARTGS